MRNGCLQVVFLLLSLMSATVEAEDTQIQRVILVSGELPPQTSAELPHFGYINHLIAQAFARVNIKAEFEFLPWARAYKEAKEGRYIASSYWYNDPKHHENFYASDGIISERTLFFRKVSDLPIKTFADVKRHGLRIGLTRGYTYTQDMWQYASDNPSLVSIVNTQKQSFKMLLMGRIDIYPAEEVSGWYSLTHHFSAEQVQTIETTKTALTELMVSVMFSKAHPDGKRLMTLFNKGLKLAKQDGTFARLHEAYVQGKYAPTAK